MKQTREIHAQEIEQLQDAIKRCKANTAHEYEKMVIFLFVRDSSFNIMKVQLIFVRICCQSMEVEMQVLLANTPFQKENISGEVW